MTFGLRDTDLRHLSSAFQGHPLLRRVLVYGSRARGTHRRSSDIDLAVEAPGMPDSEFQSLKESLENAPLIYSLDVVRMDDLKDAGLKAAILRDGREIPVH